MKTIVPKTLIPSVIVLIALSAAAQATVLNSKQVDKNGDGFLTLDEVNKAFPQIKAEEFSAMDMNSDGVLDSAEVTSAQDAGLMPKT